MRVLLDTNVVLDPLLDRAPHAVAAARIFSLIERNVLDGCLCATTVTTIHYLATKTVGQRASHEQIKMLLRLFSVAPVNRQVLELALADGGFTDFEDAVLHEAARHDLADALVTRNESDFLKAQLPVYSPAEFLEMIGAHQHDGRTETDRADADVEAGLPGAPAP